MNEVRGSFTFLSLETVLFQGKNKLIFEKADATKSLLLIFL